jgi:outer membrane protein
MKSLIRILALLLTLGVASPVLAETKIGYVDLPQVMQSAPALEMGKKLQAEFSPRLTQLQQVKKQLTDKQSALDKESTKLSEADIKARSKEITELNIELERKQREFNEDVDLRKKEDLAKFQDQLNKIIVSIGQAEGYDLILYNNIAFSSKKNNITDKVISALNK